MAGDDAQPHDHWDFEAAFSDDLRKQGVLDLGLFQLLAASHA